MRHADHIIILITTVYVLELLKRNTIHAFGKYHKKGLYFILSY